MNNHIVIDIASHGIINITIAITIAAIVIKYVFTMIENG